MRNGVLHVIDSHFENNQAALLGPDVGGGAIYVLGVPEVVISGSSFIGNRAANGGAIGMLFANPAIYNSIFEDNTAEGIGQNLTVRASTFMGNRSGVNVAGEQLGGPLGGLWINNGSVELENSTFYDNQPSGLDVEGSGGSVTNATFVNSRPGGNFTIDNSLFVDTQCDSTLAGANNVQWPEGGTACAGGSVSADPQIAAIGDNGGPTPTIMPGAVGAVAGVGVDCPAVDQRGQPRDTGSGAAGAVEP